MSGYRTKLSAGLVWNCPAGESQECDDLAEVHHRLPVGRIDCISLAAAPRSRDVILFDFETNDGVLNLGGEFQPRRGPVHRRSRCAS